MKTTCFKLTTIIIAIAIAVIITSCGKNNREDATLSSEDNTLAENTFSDIFNQVDVGYEEASNSKKGIADTSCPTITLVPFDTVTFPKTLTIDFGSSCTDARGVTRSGKIIATISDRYRQAGTIITVTLDNYKRNGCPVTGTKTITNMGKNTDGHTYYEITVKNASITTDKGTIHWESTREREWIEGEDTKWPYITDDVYLITGSASGTNASGKTFTITITKALRVELDCRWIVSGTFEITPDGVPTRTVDYGEGSCDNKAKLTIKNKTVEIILR